jgi:hypothetical protein
MTTAKTSMTDRQKLETHLIKKVEEIHQTKVEKKKEEKKKE